MKGIAQILFGCAMLLLSVASAALIPATQGYIFYVIALAAPIVGVIFAIVGLVNASRELKKGNMQEDKSNEENKN